MKKAYSIENTNLMYLFNNTVNLTYKETLRTFSIPIFKEMNIRTIYFDCDKSGLIAYIQTNGIKDTIKLNSKRIEYTKSINLIPTEIFSITLENPTKTTYNGVICIAVEYELC